MANTLGAYDPIYFAQRSLALLEKKLTFAPTMYRAYEENAQEKGSTIRVRKPGKFTAADMPIASASDMKTEYFDITLSNHKGVVVALTDKDMSLDGDAVLRDHFDPMMQAVAEAIESSCVDMYKSVPWYVDADSTTPINDWINARKRLNLNGNPDSDRWYAVNYTQEAVYLGLAAFNQVQTAGADAAGTLREGIIGRKFGLTGFSNPTLGTHTPGALSTSGTVAIQGAHSQSATSVIVDASTSMTGTVKAGDSFVIAGHTQRYAITADATASGNAITLSIHPPLAQDYTDNSVVTFRQSTKEISLAYNRQAFALVMAPLTDAANGNGVVIGTAVDDQTGLTIRVRQWYNAAETKNYLGVDALWGVKPLDGNRAVRVEN